MGIIAAGEMDKRITIERNSPMKDGHGNQVASWAMFKRTWAKVWYGTGADRRAAAADNASQSATFQIRRNSATATITPADRIQYRGRAWDIQGIAELDRDDIEITATSRTIGGLA